MQTTNKDWEPHLEAGCGQLAARVHLDEGPDTVVGLGVKRYGLHDDRADGHLLLRYLPENKDNIQLRKGQFTQIVSLTRLDG